MIPGTFKSAIAVHPLADDTTEYQDGQSAGEPKHSGQQQFIVVDLHEEQTYGELPHTITL